MVLLYTVFFPRTVEHTVRGGARSPRVAPSSSSGTRDPPRLHVFRSRPSRYSWESTWNFYIIVQSCLSLISLACSHRSTLHNSYSPFSDSYTLYPTLPSITNVSDWPHSQRDGRNLDPKQSNLRWAQAERISRPSTKSLNLFITHNREFHCSERTNGANCFASRIANRGVC